MGSIDSYRGSSNSVKGGFILIISKLKKIKDPKKVIRCTLGLGGLFLSGSLIYLFFLNGYNQAAILGTTGICLLIHAGYVLSKKQTISSDYMAQSYLISAGFLFILWGMLSFFNSIISGIWVFMALSIISFLGAVCIKKYKVQQL